MLFHFSYHKCLTVYYARVMRAALTPESRVLRRLQRFSHETLGRPAGYRHFNSLVKRFYREWPRYRASSVNNHRVDLRALSRKTRGTFRATHFIRDPRDLVVSGYFYHRRGAEAWSRTRNPKPKDFEVVNGGIPAAMPPGISFSEYLAGLDKEEGLLAEMEFRTPHLEAMRRWDYEHPNCQEFHYEDLIGNEVDTFERIFEHYEVKGRVRERGLRAVQRYAARQQAGKTQHIRNPSAGQWRDHFTDRLSSAFEERFPGLVTYLGYSWSSPP